MILANIFVPSVYPSATPEEDKDEDCSNFHLGTTIFKCHTEDEWRKVAEKQCSLRLTTPTEILFVEVRYACHGSSGSSPAFMQATVSCCGKGQDSGEATKDPPTIPPVTTAPGKYNDTLVGAVQ